MIKPATKAQQKAQDYRDALNPGKIKILAKDHSSCVYIYNDVNGKPCARGYAGRALKPAFSYRYGKVEARDAQVTEFMTRLSERKATTKRENATRNLVVGDVLRASWGYDQTNIDYYLVVGLVGKAMVEVVEIGAHSENNGNMTGTSAPDVTNKIGEVMRKKATGANGDTVKIDHTWARKMVPEMIGGVAVYNKSNWTAYA